ncbi:MAG: hypothetical protein J6W57_06160 [Oscillospiraceae bacterium]|nr:hypothetical protein [Oscillospiraceae bacterium]
MNSSYYCDYYGRTRSGNDVTSPVDIPMPYQVACTSSTESGTSNKIVVRYTRFQGVDKKVAQWRETTIFDATTNDILSYTHEFAWDFWANREDDTVVWVPINECWDYKQKYGV